MQTKAICNTLIGFKDSLTLLSNTEFTTPIKGLSGSTIGEHTRHIIELFQCLVNGYQLGLVNYDKRERNLRIQTDIDTAIDCISFLISQIKLENKKLTLCVEINEEMEQVETNYFRELLYNFEHCIHHQALIKVGFLELNKNLIDANFGVAVSTIKYRKECAQ